MKLDVSSEPAVLPAAAPCILVVEDEVLIRMLVADHLRSIGLVVVEAFNADEAIDILKSGAEIDLIFTDVRMPGAVDGLALAYYTQRTRPDLPVVMTSGHLEPRLAYSCGVAAFLAKPSTLEQIESAIRAALLGAG